MVVRIRFMRIGRKRQPFYRIVAANGHTGRNKKPIEYIGTFNPMPMPDGTKELIINMERLKYWMGVGAQLTDPAARLFGRAGILPPFPARNSRFPGIPKKERPKV